MPPITAYHLAEAVQAGERGASDAVTNNPPPHSTMPSQTEHAVLARAMQWLDTDLTDDRSFLTGDKFTIADIAAVTVIDFAALIGLDHVAGNPAVEAWHARVSSRPSVSSEPFN